MINVKIPHRNIIYTYINNKDDSIHKKNRTLKYNFTFKNHVPLLWIKLSCRVDAYQPRKLYITRWSATHYKLQCGFAHTHTKKNIYIQPLS